MFAGFSETLSIDEIAELWSRETDEPATIIRRTLLKAFQPKLGSRFIEISGDAVISRADLLAFCEEQDIKPPKFWGKAAAVVSSSSRAESDCRKWIRELRAKGYIQPNKSALRDEALEMFPGLSGRGFDRAWDLEAAPNWKQQGRRRRTVENQ